MRIQALKTLLDGNVYTNKGAVVEVDDFKAKELIALGYAVHIPEPEESPAAPISFGAPEPFPEPPAGGPGGSVTPASSSQEAPARQKRPYKKRAAKSGS